MHNFPSAALFICPNHFNALALRLGCITISTSKNYVSRRKIISRRFLACWWKTAIRFLLPPPGQFPSTNRTLLGCETIFSDARAQLATLFTPSLRLFGGQLMTYPFCIQKCRFRLRFLSCICTNSNGFLDAPAPSAA